MNSEQHWQQEHERDERMRRAVELDRLNVGTTRARDIIDRETEERTRMHRARRVAGLE